MNIPIEIIVVVLASLLTGLGFLVTVVINAFSKNTRAFNSINDSIQEIRLWITKKDTSDVYEERECKTMHDSINKRFDNHEKRITYLEKK